MLAEVVVEVVAAMEMTYIANTDQLQMIHLDGILCQLLMDKHTLTTLK